MRLGVVLKKYRIMSEKSTRDMSTEIGIDNATYWRVENGQAMTAQTLASIFCWLTGNEKAPEAGQKQMELGEVEKETPSVTGDEQC